MKARLEYLYQCYINETSTKSEHEEFFSLIEENNQNLKIEDLLDGTWNDFNTEAGLSPDKAARIYRAILEEHQKLIVKRVFWYRYAAAAMFILISGLGYILLKENSQQQKPDTNVSFTNNIAPGKSRAVLTLSNGSKISLDQVENGELAQQAGTNITKSSDGKLVYVPSSLKNKSGQKFIYNTIETPKGGQYLVSLSDGTKVWLNAASSLKYPATFTGNERKVELIGEAYFEVAHNKKMPFIVKTAQQAVEVLGTHFNINSYADEPATKTTLLEGAVRVTYTLRHPELVSGSRTGNQNIILKPGQQSILLGNNITVETADLDEAVSWKNGFFVFNEADLGNIMRQLGRWYNIDVVFSGKIPIEHFHGKVSRNMNLTDVLKIFELGGIDFKMEGRKLIVKS